MFERSDFLVTTTLKCTLPKICPNLGIVRRWMGQWKDVDGRVERGGWESGTRWMGERNEVDGRAKGGLTCSHDNL